MSKYKFIRWTVYIAETILLYIIQLTPGLLPAVGGVRPVLLISSALCIAMFEGDMGGLFIGILSGFFIDLGGNSVIGFHSILLGLCCYFIGLLTMQLVRTNILTCLMFGAVSIVLICFSQWFFYFVIWRYLDQGYALLHHYLPKMAYTFCVLPVLYFFNRVFALRLGEAA
mgnify:CR=1 FL=1